jgi:hypothetical protein
VLVQPFTVPVTVYVAVDAGTNDEPFVTPLLQVYCVAPLAVNELLPPAQIDAGDALAEIIGNAFTVIVRIISEDGPLHPLAVTEMIAVPEKPLDQVIIPLVAFIVPAPTGDTDQLNPVLLFAVVAYVVVVVPLVN